MSYTLFITEDQYIGVFAGIITSFAQHCLILPHYFQLRTVYCIPLKQECPIISKNIGQMDAWFLTQQTRKPIWLPLPKPFIQHLNLRVET